MQNLLLLPLLALMPFKSLHFSESAPPTSVNRSLMLQMVNEVRKKGCQCGDTYYYPAEELVWNEKLEAAAFSHSSDMYSRKYFSHRNPEGRNGGYRLEQAGYDWAAFGENLGYGYRTEKAVLEGWLKSPTHCRNIMNKMYKEMGVARVGGYWTQEFGRK